MHSSTVNQKIIALSHLQNSFARNTGNSLLNSESIMETDYFEGQFKVDFMNQLSEIHGSYESSILSNISNLIAELRAYKSKLEREEEAAREAARLRRLQEKREREALEELKKRAESAIMLDLHFSE